VKRPFSLLSATLFSVFGVTSWASGDEWSALTGKRTLTQFMSGLKVERMLPNGEISRGEYRPDGTGTLYSWGEVFPRTWRIEDQDRLCITDRQRDVCYFIDRHRTDPDRYRVREVATGKQTEIRVSEQRVTVDADPKSIGSDGGAATPSADELAAELSNPNTAVASLTFKNQFRWYDGDLPDASKQSNYTLLFQPALPFVLGNGDKVIWRPAIPFIVDQPIPKAGGGFDGESGLGDIAFDLVYAPKRDDGLLLAYGLITSLPTATNDLGSDRWTLGPEVFIAKSYTKGLYGIFPSHQWDIGGSGDRDINLTTIQPIFTYLPGDGWNVGTGPSVTYDWEAEQWTVPLQVNFGKTVMVGGRPWKLSAEINYYVEKADLFGPEWMLSLNVTPVVKNGLASWFGL
jgi:hypothetical protein